VIISPHFVDYHCSIPLVENQIRRELRSWLSPPDPSINFNTASDAHHEGTALWFIEGDSFNDWKASGSLLWLHGKRSSLSFSGFAFANGLPLS
jgi:hypothetical protein